MLSTKFKVYFCIFLFLFLFSSPTYAITKAELLYGVFSELGFTFAGQDAQLLPPDVENDHSYSNVIRSSVYYGILSSKSPFEPDAPITKNDALLLTLYSMGWNHVVTLNRKLSELPELSGSGNPISFLCSEIKPQAPESLLLDGESFLTVEEFRELKNWIVQCKQGVTWNKVFSFNSTDLILFKQGLGSTNMQALKTTNQPPLFIAALAIQPSFITTEVTFSEPSGLKLQAPLSEIARINNAIGAVNGGFFHANLPIGTIVKNKIPLGGSYGTRSAIGIDEQGNPSFGPGTLQTTLEINQQTFSITAFSRPPQQEEISLYTALLTPVIKNLPTNTRVFHVEEEVITNVIDYAGLPINVPNSGVLIAIGPSLLRRFNPIQIGDSAKMQIAWQHAPFSRATTIVQAGPMLLQNQAPSTTGNEAFKADILYKRHPRTFVGHLADGRLLWGVVDGRNMMHSVGTTIPETIKIAQSLGLVDALNLDGGGSSTLWWRGFIVNKPSNGKERPLPYAILFKNTTAKN